MEVEGVKIASKGKKKAVLTELESWHSISEPISAVRESQEQVERYGIHYDCFIYIYNYWIDKAIIYYIFQSLMI